MRWFGFGFNAFGQINGEKLAEGACSGAEKEVKVTSPTELTSHADGHSCMCLAGFGITSESRGVTEKESHGCEDASIGESYLTLAFPDRLECWDLTGCKVHFLLLSGPTLNLPLVPGGYIGAKPPFYRSLSPHLKAKSLALSAEHAVLLGASGAVYTWGLGRHGQLGHGGLTSEEEPRAVEALGGMPMSYVATGSWHSMGVTFMCGAGMKVASWDFHHAILTQVFISIQAFPALLDVSPSCELMAVSCGSRHTAAVTTTGDLYTWGWGEYGQLGHQSLMSTDEPQCVEFFREQKMRVIDVVCGPWNTFAAVKEEVA
uniref:RCC1 domain containing 1 n=1 Tax=Mola mola TaxID=94237 RepID=A0A3Q4BQF7_MOLML